MKHKPGHRVSFYDRNGVTHLGRVTDASREHVTVKLDDGRTIRFEDHDGVGRLSRVHYRRRR